MGVMEWDLMETWEDIIELEPRLGLYDMCTYDLEQSPMSALRC